MDVKVINEKAEGIADRGVQVAIDSEATGPRADSVLKKLKDLPYTALFVGAFIGATLAGLVKLAL